MSESNLSSTETRKTASVSDRRESKAGTRRSQKPAIEVESKQTETTKENEQMTQSNDTQANETHNQESEVETVNTQTQETQEQKPMTAFEKMQRDRLEFEGKRVEAILAVRNLCDDWQIDLKKDVYPESIKPRKPYTKRVKADASASPSNSPASLQTASGEATPQASETKALEPAPV